MNGDDTSSSLYPSIATDDATPTNHFNHPHRPLRHITIPDPYTCQACRDYGSGKRFACSLCDFQLHECCAMAPPSLPSHPFHPQHPLVLHPKPEKRSKCDVCGRATKGCSFKCAACGTFQIHPCCAMLSDRIKISSHAHTLVLAAAGGSETCKVCNRRRKGRMYQCTKCDYALHAVCAKDMANGLRLQEKAGIIAVAGKVASKVVINFIGGLVEGIGEGVGQAIVSSVIRGHRPPNQR